MKLSPYTKALLAAYRELKAAGKSYDEIRSDPRLPVQEPGGQVIQASKEWRSLHRDVTLPYRDRDDDDESDNLDVELELDNEFVILRQEDLGSRDTADEQEMVMLSPMQARRLVSELGAWLDNLDKLGAKEQQARQEQNQLDVLDSFRSDER